LNQKKICENVKNLAGSVKKITLAAEKNFAFGRQVFVRCAYSWNDGTREYWAQSQALGQYWVCFASY